jgi:amino acid permease
LPAGKIVWFIKAAYAGVLVIMSELILFPAHEAIESYMFGSWEKSKKRQWCKNLSRTLLWIFITMFTLSLNNKLDKFIAIIGALSMTP